MITVLDYDAGNIKSVEKALDFLGEEVKITRDREEILSADGVILPGVGAFGDALEKLHQYGLVDVIHEVVDRQIPFLGICLGLQLMFESSEETPGVEGLHLLDGKIRRIPAAFLCIFCTFLLSGGSRSIQCYCHHRIWNFDSCFRGKG